MSQALVQSADCCSPCPDIPITQVPGPPGDDGTDGTDGAAASNAFTETTDSFTMPAVSGNVTVDVLDSTWMAVGQIVFVENAGYFTVNAVPDAVSVSLTNLGYDGNAAPTTIIPASQKVSPGGKKGTDGSTSSSTLNDLSPTNLKGDLIVDTGANNPDADDVRFSAGSNGQILTSLSTQPAGLMWQTLLPNGATDNVLPRYDASGTTIPTPLQTSGMLLTDTAALQQTGGNAKGTDAVDLQPVRAAATQVASGSNAVLGGGQNNTASGSNATVGGGDTNVASGSNSAIAGGSHNTTTDDNTTVAGGLGNDATGEGAAIGGGEGNAASGDWSVVAGGFTNTVSGNRSACLGGTLNSVTGNDASALGGDSALLDKSGQVGHATGRFTDIGDAQTSELVWRIITTDATVDVEMFLDGSAARATVPADTTWAFEIIATARRSDGMSICFKVDGGIKNDGGTVVLVAALTTIVTADGTGAALGAANFVVSADDPNNSLKLAVTGQVAQTWRWVARARLVECGH